MSHRALVKSVTGVQSNDPAHMPVSAWTEHVPFARWLIAAQKPRVAVELGAHHGMSYFAMCETVRSLGLTTAMHAVDTWQGDEHAGFYGEEVFDRVGRVNAAYSDFSSLHRTTFDNALAEFADGSIDLLHIDGFHTYEAVKHDFETWLPKVSSRGIVLFHDISVLDQGFAVWKLWAEISKLYPHFAFEHGFGLGVLCVGRHQSARVLELARLTEPEATLVRYLFAAKGELILARQEGRDTEELNEKLRFLNAELALRQTPKAVQDIVDLARRAKRGVRTLLGS